MAHTCNASFRSKVSHRWSQTLLLCPDITWPKWALPWYQGGLFVFTQWFKIKGSEVQAINATFRESFQLSLSKKGVCYSDSIFFLSFSLSLSGLLFLSLTLFFSSSVSLTLSLSVCLKLSGLLSVYDMSSELMTRKLNRSVMVLECCKCCVCIHLPSRKSWLFASTELDDHSRMLM